LVPDPATGTPLLVTFVIYAITLVIEHDEPKPNPENEMLIYCWKFELPAKFKYTVGAIETLIKVSER
jgi:hypothetical protein